MDAQQVATLRDGALVCLALLGGLLLLPATFLAVVLNRFVRRGHRRLRGSLDRWRGELRGLEERSRDLSRGLTRPLVRPLALLAGISQALRVWRSRR